LLPAQNFSSEGTEQHHVQERAAPRICEQQFPASVPGVLPQPAAERNRGHTPRAHHARVATDLSPLHVARVPEKRLLVPSHHWCRQTRALLLEC